MLRDLRDIARVFKVHNVHPGSFPATLTHFLLWISPPALHLTCSEHILCRILRISLQMCGCHTSSADNQQKQRKALGRATHKFYQVLRSLKKPTHILKEYPRFKWLYVAITFQGFKEFLQRVLGRATAATAPIPTVFCRMDSHCAGDPRCKSDALRFWSAAGQSRRCDPCTLCPVATRSPTRNPNRTPPCGRNLGNASFTLTLYFTNTKFNQTRSASTVLAKCWVYDNCTDAFGIQSCAGKNPTWCNCGNWLKRNSATMPH